MRGSSPATMLRPEGSFHYSRLDSALDPIARGVCPNGGTTAECVFRIGLITASYIHFYFVSQPGCGWAAICVMSDYPQRIVCRTAETTETLYLLGVQHRIAGISGVTVRPPQARREKPKVSAFTTVRIDRILALQPDLALGFSELQADILTELLHAGVAVHVFNQRTVSGISDMIGMIAALVGAPEKWRQLVERLRAGLADIVRAAAALGTRARIYFEERDDPLICGIGWVSEPIGIAGGTDCFADLFGARSVRKSIIADSAEMVRRRPCIIIGSWCGKRLRSEQVAARPDWEATPAVRDGHVYY